jgi:hydrogenase maturation protease
VSYWEQLERPGPDAVDVDGVRLRRRSRVRLRPRRAADVWDIALAGRTGVIEEIVESTDGQVQLAVTVLDDPGRDLGVERQIGHRFFFAPDEVEPLGADGTAPVPTARILVAGIGNVFLGDDGFGVAVAGRLARSELPPGVVVEDFGIRGMGLAYALAGYDVAMLVDALPRGSAPGTLYLVEPEIDDAAAEPDGHGMSPVKVLAMARHLGGRMPRVLVLGCEPAEIMDLEDELKADLSEPVRAALDEAVRMVEALLDELTAPESHEATEKELS